ncbi:MAG: LemA family protein [Bacteroidetes bacterium]|nr:LemA family protein [Bacteroidota bacterium]
MKRSTIIVLVLVILSILFVGGCNTYNNLVSKRNEVDNKWADVQSQYQRRLDLIPNLVKTVKGYADFEKSTLQAVVEARAKATSINVTADNLDEATIAKINAQMGNVNSALSRLLAVVENYPNLKADQNFLKLQDELAGTENRIAVARDNFNEVVKLYNNACQRFPAVIFASILGFKSKPYFKADEGAEKAPKVEF